MHEVTQLLEAIERGDRQATSELLPLVYDELRHLAAHLLAREKAGQTLQPTALVHEAYLRLVGHQEASWEGRRHFFAAAAEAMRRILVERARHKQSAKAGGHMQRRALPDLEQPAGDPAFDLLGLNEALDKLEQLDPRKAEVVKLRFFAGMTIEQTAQILGISPSTADNDWAYARCWLRLAIEGQPPGPPAGK
jgi:RNA polymerase sigma factor (TIGR02999 family)